MKQRLFYLCAAIFLLLYSVMSVCASGVSDGDAMAVQGGVWDTGMGVTGSGVSAGDAQGVGAAVASTDPALQAEPNIEVAVPSSDRIIVNPYHMEVGTSHATSTDQIISGEQFLVNHSNVPIRVNVSATGSPVEGSELCFAETMGDLHTGSKAVYLYMEFQPSPDGSTVLSWDGEFRDTEHQLLISSRETARDGVLTMAAGDQEPTYGVYRFFGAAAGSPDRPWTARDTFELTVVFQFEPVE